MLASTMEKEAGCCVESEPDQTCKGKRQESCHFRLHGVGHFSHGPTSSVLVYTAVLVFFSPAAVVVTSTVSVFPSALSAMTSLTSIEAPEGACCVPSATSDRPSHFDVTAIGAALSRGRRRLATRPVETRVAFIDLAFDRHRSIRRLRDVQRLRHASGDEAEERRRGDDRAAAAIELPRAGEIRRLRVKHGETHA